MYITIIDPTDALTLGLGLALGGLGIYLITCAIGLALAIQDGRNADN